MKTIILALSFLLAFSVIAGRSIPRNYYRAEGRHWGWHGRRWWYFWLSLVKSL